MRHTVGPPTDYGLPLVDADAVAVTRQTLRPHLLLRPPVWRRCLMDADFTACDHVDQQQAAKMPYK